MANNYTLGRGEIHFARFKTGTEEPEGFRYIGNTPELNLTIEQETLDHFSSDRGVREKDDSIPLQVNRTGSMTTDNIDPENVALFFFGSKTDLTVVGATVTDESHEGVLQGHSYQLGLSDARPSGARSIVYPGVDTTVFSLTSDPTATTYVRDTDYTLDVERGIVTIIEGGGIADGDDILVNYTTNDTQRVQVISGSAPVEGAMRYLAFNPKGTNFDFYMPKVLVSPNGDFALKSEEWQQIPFTLEVLKRTDREAIYVDGKPFITV